MPPRLAAVLPSLGLLAALAPRAAAQELAAEPQPTRSGHAVQVLIRQAERWLEQAKPDAALASLERVLAAEPRNPAALALAVRAEAERNNRAGANAYLARLRESGATEAERSTADNAARSVAVDRGALDEARQLARSGRGDTAAARYREIFGGQPPAAFALEYYQTLAGTAAGAEEGRKGLETLANRGGADARSRLAYAQSLTWQQNSRLEGVRRLAALADSPGFGTEGRAAWRQALLWSVGEPAFSAEAETYLRHFPDDTEFRGRLEQQRATAVPADPNAATRQQGFAALDAGKVDRSAGQFEAALAANPADADALGGLGIARLRQGRAAEAKPLLERAIAASPDGAAKWRGALDGASYTLELAEARAMLRRGDAEAAGETARRAARRAVDDTSDASQLLGEIALRQRDAASAERHFRAVLARRPSFQSARLGLNAALQAQGRAVEFPNLVATAQSGEASASSSSARLRAEAASQADPGVTIAMLRGGLEGTPDDPWLRLDLARALRRNGRALEGRAFVEELAARDGRGEAAFAAALLAEEEDRAADAESFLTRIPLARRTGEVARLQARVKTRAEIARAAAALGIAGGAGRDRLLTLAARPDPTGTTTAGVVRAFVDANDRFGAMEAARIGLSANRAAGAPARRAIAGALLQAGLETEATAAASGLDETKLSPDQRRDLAALRTGIAVQGADRLNESGDQAQAFELLRPVLEREPDNMQAQLALVRLHEGARQPAQASRIAEAMLTRDPRNMEARRAAVTAAIARRDRARAEALVAEAQASAPRDSRGIFMAGEVARAFGQTERARQLYTQAAMQRQAELGRASPLRLASTGGYAGVQNPFTGASARAPSDAVALPTDRISREIQEASASLQRESAPQLTVPVTVRTRSGSAGLDRLQEVSAPIESTLPVSGLHGTLVAQVTPVALSTGTLSSDSASTSRLGALALGGAGRLRTDVEGVSFGVGYRSGDLFRADAGTSPLGFTQSNVVGGIELAPQLTDSLKLRVTGERRSVTDSLLSWSGLRDPQTGRTWGGVTRTGARAQLETSLVNGRGYAYASGGWASFDGKNIQQNTRIEASAGFGYPFLRTPDSELAAGLDLVYLAYENNQRHFTLGQGGYFSPQSYVALNLPVDYRSHIGDLSYRLGGTLGYAVWREDAANAFPTDPALQAQAEGIAAQNPSVLARFPGQSRSGFVGSLRADVEYPLTPSLSIGAGLRYDKAANWDETRANLRLNNRF